MKKIFAAKKILLKCILSFTILVIFPGFQQLHAQVNDTTFHNPYDTTNHLRKDTVVQKTYRVAIVAPLYLDSVFAGSVLRSETSIPAFTIAGTDFVQGAELALDTLITNGKHVEAFIYDSKSASKPLLWLLKNGKLDNLDLIIGSVKEPEYSLLSQFAAQRSIPFVSATYPNDGGVRQNPFLYIANSTLKAHCESIFSYLLQKHGADNIYLVKKKNDNRIDNYFREINFKDGHQLLKIKTIMLDSSISPDGLRYLVDTTKPIVIIGASLNKAFSQKLADACYPLQKRKPLILIGMPNWDGFDGFYQKDAYTDFPIRYTTPHYEVKDNALSRYINDKYFQKYRINPSDMAEKGFEAAYDFISILINHPNDFLQHMNDTTFAPFHDFNFQPVFHDRAGTVPDYYENKHLFIMQILNGQVVREW
jgi:hypothetical protein